MIYGGGFSAFLRIDLGWQKALLWPFFLVESALVELHRWEEEQDRKADVDA